MLCIAVAPESRRLGKVDLYNAAGQCDLIEFRLDRLGKEPDLKEIMDGISKPILVSCRRREDGGSWHGTEEERLLQLRTAIIAGPAYVELELDIADKIPRFGNTKRVVSVTDLKQPLKDLEPVINQAIAAKADVIKFVGLTPTLDAAWPLLATVTKKRDIPVVGMGLGKPGVMFSLLAHKYGAPWTYAALEHGLEAYPGQVTVSDLAETYRWRDIGAHTWFIGVTGFGPGETATVKAFNAGFAHHQLNIRCLPLELGLSHKLNQMLDALQVNALLANSQVCERALNLADTIDEAARKAQYADLVVKQPDGRHAYNTTWKSVLRVVEGALGAKSSEDRPLDRRNVFVIGGGGLARSVALGAQKRKGILSIAAADDNEARQLAQMTGARFVPLANMYDTLCDVVLIAEAQSFSLSSGSATGGPGVKLNPAFLREHMYVADLTRLPEESDLLREARSRGCKIVEPADIFVEYVTATFKTITGKELPAELVREALPAAE
ncbi:MAG TPA: type I 3-dehydroquinate dehydratase [Planctomycetaceae bacterium]|jgi:3-dehydroquinate dehydratase/shikimate dehydrogenase|nr:type I 3-dehydroquinate dehydratase [Planctomycetaceae bacterium]